MSGYSEKLKDPRWQKKRLEILNRDDFKCVMCKDDKTELHIHHSKYRGNPWEVEDKHLNTVCKHCHGAIHNMNLKTSPVLIKAVKIFDDTNKSHDLYLRTPEFFVKLIIYSNSTEFDSMLDIGVMRNLLDFHFKTLKQKKNE